MAIAGTNLYVLSTILDGGDGIGTVGKYNLDGSVVNASLITNIAGYPQNLAVSDTNIFVASGNAGVIGKYTTSGATINASLITGLASPRILAISGTNLFVTDDSGNKVGEYSFSGATQNATLISGLLYPNGIAVAPTFQSIAATNSTVRLTWYAVEGQNYQLQYKTNLTQPGWLNLPGPITATTFTASASNPTSLDRQRFYRVLFLP